MRSKHTLSALLASALLFAGAGSALAASVQIVLPEETVPGGSRAQLTVTTDVPGFLTLTLTALPVPSRSVKIRKCIRRITRSSSPCQMKTARRWMSALTPSTAS